MKKRNSQCKQEFPEVRIKRQILDHYLKATCKITLYYGIFSIEIVSSKPNHTTHQIQTDVINIEISKVFTDYIKINNTKIHKKQIQYLQTMFYQISIAIYLY